MRTNEVGDAGYSSEIADCSAWYIIFYNTVIEGLLLLS